ncbi:MAG: hypothetical protein WBE72_12120 [Terracidiphilus sp.]
MDRRTFNKLAGLAAIGTVARNVEAQRDQAGPASGIEGAGAGEIVLEDSELLVAFDRLSGALTRLERKSSGWLIERRPELGLSFRLLAPLPNRRANFVLGEKQHAAAVEKISDHEVRLRWKGLVSEHGGVLPLAFTATVTLNGGSLTFESTLANDSDLTIETVDYPYLGDLSAPARGIAMTSEHMWYGNLVSDQLYPVFHDEKGYWGVNFPTKTIESKQSLFSLIQAPQQGLYVGMNDPAQPYLMEWTFEQHPGVLQSIGDPVPPEDAISGLPVHLEFRACHFVFVHPHSSRRLAPVVLRAYDGDWHAGLDVYKQWRSTWFQPPHIAAWALDLHAWLQLQIDGAEQDYSIPYRDLPRYIDECAANGVTAIQLVGWELGGQDGGDPSLDTDPGLGTWEELHQAILHARGKGVKIILFGKPIWADRTTEWCKRELYKYAATDPYGIPYETGGYSYTTPTQLAGINNRRRYVMDVQCQAYRDIATKEFEKTVALGAAGWLFDEVCHHGPVEYSFSNDRGYPAPGYIYGGDMPMAKQFRAAADKVDRDFVFAGEGPQDWLMQYYPVSYFRIGPGSRPVCRYIDPMAPLLVAVTGFDDREMLNLILLNRYIVSYEPYNFKGRIADFPLTLAYGRKIDALRRKYKAWIWDAGFRDTLGAQVTADGMHRYSVFVAGNGKRSVIVVNLEAAKSISATVDLPHPGSLVVATPEQPESEATAGKLTIPARSAAVLMEQ